MQMSLFPISHSEKFNDFLKFYADNTHVYWLFRQFAMEAVEAGSSGIGGRAIWERIRWEVRVKVQTDSTPKMNDHHVPYFTRLLMMREPKVFEGMFVVKDTKFDTDSQDILNQCNLIDAQRN